MNSVKGRTSIKSLKDQSFKTTSPVVKKRLVDHNKNLSQMYGTHIIREWTSSYIHIDTLERMLHLAPHGTQSFRDFENEFVDEVLRVNEFIEQQVKEVEMDIDAITVKWSRLDSNERSSILGNSHDHALTRSMQFYLRKTEAILKFYKLNSYIMAKLRLEFDRLSMKKGTLISANFVTDIRVCNRRLEMSTSEEAIIQLQKRCTDIYTSIFHSSAPALAFGDLLFPSSEETEVSSAKIGCKIGIIIGLVLWMAVDAGQNSDLDFWTNPGLFAFACVGNVLIFKITWAINVWAWAQWDVDYIDAFGFDDMSPNPLQILNETLSIFVIYSGSMLLYFRSNTEGTPLYGTIFSHMWPFLVVVLIVVYLLYENVPGVRRGASHTRGIFDRAVLWRCLWAPLYPVSFHDNYAADTLTSFTKVISDAAYATCWVFFGHAFRPGVDDDKPNFGHSCKNSATVKYLVAALVLLPQWLRVLQCFRKWYDAGNITRPFPHGFNALKYALSMLVVVYGLLPNGSDAAYYAIICVATLYKWWWDVVMDWNLFVTGPCAPQYPLLRPIRMYPRDWWYYASIALDLVLRYLWVVSLLPLDSHASFVGPVVSIFLGSLEIVRRSLAGIFRVEVEHLKMGEEYPFSVLLRHEDLVHFADGKVKGAGDGQGGAGDGQGEEEGEGGDTTALLIPHDSGSGDWLQAEYDAH